MPVLTDIHGVKKFLAPLSYQYFPCLSVAAIAERYCAMAKSGPIQGHPEIKREDAWKNEHMIVKIIGLLFVSYLVFLNLVGPLIVLRRQRLPARVNFKPVDIEVILSSGHELVFNAWQEIISLGFSYIGTSVLHSEHCDNYFLLFSHSEAETIAMIGAVESKIDTFSYVEFLQLYADGSMLGVSNARMPSPFPQTSLKLLARFPSNEDAKRLYGVFLDLKKSLRNSAEPVGYPTDGGFSGIEEFIRRESDELVRQGYCLPMIDNDGMRSLTLKGAFLLTWKSVFPGSRIVDIMERKRSQRILEGYYPGNNII